MQIFLHRFQRKCDYRKKFIRLYQFIYPNKYIKNGETTLKSNMAKENIILDVRLKQTDETRNYVLEEWKHNDLISKKHNRLCITLNILSVVVFQFLHLLH